MTPEEIIREQARIAGINPDEAVRFAQIESSLNPNPKTGNGGGLFQINPDNWKKWGRGSITDPTANAAAFMNWHKNVLQPEANRIVGGSAEPWQRYLVHQQGQGGAEGLLKNPDMPAVEAIAPYYIRKDDPYGLKTANKAIIGNGGRAQDFARDFSEHWRATYNMQPLPNKNIGPSPSVAEVSLAPALPPYGVPGNPEFDRDRTRDGADMGGFGSSPPIKSPPVKPFYYDGLLRLGPQVAAMGEGQPVDQPSWIRQAINAPGQVHRPQMPPGGLLSAIFPNEQRRRLMSGLLGEQ